MSRKKTHQGVEMRNTLGMKSDKNNKTWVILMDRSRAKLYEWLNINTELRLIKAWDFPSGKVKGSDLAWDQPGRVFDSKTFAHGGHQTASPRHSYGSKVNPKTLLVLKSVKSVVDWIEKNQAKEKITELACVAEPGLLGMIQKSFHKKQQPQLQRKWAKDFSWLDEDALEARIVSWLSGKAQQKKRFLPKSIGAFGPENQEAGYGT